MPLTNPSSVPAIQQLEQTMRDLALATEKQTRRLVALTWALVLMTAGLVGLTIVLLVKGG